MLYGGSYIHVRETGTRGVSKSMAAPQTGSVNPLSSGSFIQRYSDVLIAVAIVTIVIMMIIPLPTMLLDLLLCVNVTLAIVIVMVTMS